MSAKDFFKEYSPLFLVPIACVGASVLINILLATAKVLDESALSGSPPPILDVGLQLIFIAAGAIISAGTVETADPLDAERIKARALGPMIGCFFIFCAVLGSLAIAQQDWIFATRYNGFFRVIFPDLAGGALIGYCIWSFRAT